MPAPDPTRFVYSDTPASTENEWYVRRGARTAERPRVRNSLDRVKAMIGARGDDAFSWYDVENAPGLLSRLPRGVIEHLLAQDLDRDMNERTLNQAKREEKAGNTEMKRFNREGAWLRAVDEEAARIRALQASDGMLPRVGIRRFM